MASDRIDRIEGLRSTQFPTERRGGYDRAAVDAYLADFADWLDTDEAKAAIAQREIERVGERTGSILGAAQESADQITSEATSEAKERLAEVERQTAELRSSADSFANEVRSGAEDEARKVREAAEADAARIRSEAEEHARLTIREADDRLERAATSAAERTAGIENEIAGLAAKRDELVANLEALAGGLGKVIEGPGREDIELPERSRTAAAFTEEPIAHPEVADAAPFPVADADADEPPEAETEEEAVVEQETVLEEEPPFEDEAPTAVEAIPNFDTDEELYEDGRPPEPLPSGRDPERRRRRAVQDPDDPTTEDQKLTELL